MEAIENQVKLIQELQAMNLKLKGELTRIQKLMSNNRREIKEMESILLNSLKDKGSLVIAGLFKVSEETYQAVEVLDIGLVPDKFKTKRGKVNKGKVLEAMKNLESVSGIEIQMKSRVKIQ